MIVHHVSRTPLVLADLVVGGSTGRGPSRLGLWACAGTSEWQRAYGPIVNEIEIRPDARVLRTDSRSLCDRCASPSDEAWAALGAALLAEGHDVLLLEADGCPDEIVILDPAAIASTRSAPWPA